MSDDHITDNGSDEEVVFKAKKKSKNPVKSRTIVSHLENNDGAGDIITQLEEAKNFRRFRGTLHGAEITADITTTTADVAAPQRSHEKTLKLAEFEAGDDNALSLEKAKERFIQEQLEKRRAQTQTADTSEEPAPAAPPKPLGPAAPPRVLTDIDLLKSIAGAAKAPVDVDASERGERWLTGIAEVSLPISHKLSNIERTEKAREELLRKKEARIRELLEEDSEGKLGSVNYNANYRKHKRDWDEQAKAQSVLERVGRERAEAEKAGGPLTIAPAGDRGGMGTGMGMPGSTSGGGSSGGGVDAQRRYDLYMDRVRQNMNKPSHDLKALREFTKSDKKQ